MRANFNSVSLAMIIYLCDTWSYTSDSTFSDTCNGDTFKPTCPNPGNVILMLSAIYGRLKIGKCISKKEVSVLVQDIKYFGCSSDVLTILHDKCSLKNSCSVKVPDDDMDKMEPCFPGLKLYLHSEYKCIKVISQEQDCQLQVHSSPQYFTTSTAITLQRCGKSNNPWMLESPRGQKIKLVLEMTFESQGSVIPGVTTCKEEFGMAIEKTRGNVKNVTLCTNGIEVFGSHRDNEQEVSWTSSGGLIELIFNQGFIKSHEKSSKPPLILLKIETDGCLDIIPPEDTWLKRNGDDMVIGCYSSKQTWYLRCENKKWSGTIGNCSSNRQPVPSDEGSITEVQHKDEISEEQQIILFVAICSLGVVICLIIVCVGAICIKKYKWKSMNDGIYNKPPAYYNTGEYAYNGQLLHNQSKSIGNDQEPINCDLIKDQQIGEKSEDNKYFVLEEICN